ncbi:MAG: hypothetical protein AB2L21_00350 [Anaerolineaceae bacterium]
MKNNKSTGQKKNYRPLPEEQERTIRKTLKRISDTNNLYGMKAGVPALFFAIRAIPYRLGKINTTPDTAIALNTQHMRRR